MRKLIPVIVIAVFVIECRTFGDFVRRLVFDDLSTVMAVQAPANSASWVR